MPTQQNFDALLDAYAQRGVALARVTALANGALRSRLSSDAEHRVARGLAHRITVAIKPTTAERPCTYTEGHDAHTYPYGPGESAAYCPGIPRT